MNGCKLQSLANFPNLPKLVRLELIEDEFSGDDLVNLGNLAVTIFFLLIPAHRNAP